MKRKILLLFVVAPFFSAVYGQKEKKVTAFAITGIQKGQSNWTEVRLVDITTGDEVKSIYKSADQVEVLNARTGKPVAKKDLTLNGIPTAVSGQAIRELQATAPVVVFKNTARGQVNSNTNANTIINTNVNTNINTAINNRVVIEKRLVYAVAKVQSDKPFSTSSAACAYDKKHERLYYTPMGINQLRFIDLKSNKIYYFEDEPFGVLKNSHDVPNQITRMVIASDGDGYALTNDGNHLMRFTTGKKPEITDLGVLTDDAVNGANTVHSSAGYGGDMIADTRKNLYLITANRVVFRINIENRVATYLGSIKGLPKGFSTNGAVVEDGTKVIVSSSNSTQGYFRFDLVTLEGEKISTGASVFNASDLANGNLAFEKKKKEKKIREAAPENSVVVDEEVTNPESKAVPKTAVAENVLKGSISVYPNPVLNGYVKLSFADQPSGKYQVQFMDVAGKIIKTQEVTINNKVQVEEFRLPELTASGNYLVKVINAVNGRSIVNKVIVQ